MYNGTFIAGLWDENEPENDSQGCYGFLRTQSYSATFYIHDMTIHTGYSGKLCVSMNTSNGECKFSNCTFYTYYGGAIEAYDNVSLSDCIINQEFMTTQDNIWASSAVAVSYGATANVSGGSYTNTGYGAYIYSYGGTININGGDWQASTAVLKIGKSGATINVYDGAFDGVFDLVTGSILNIYGGTFENTGLELSAFEAYVPDCYSVTEADGIYTVALDMSQVVATVTDSNNENTTYYSTLTEAVSNATTGDTITVLSDTSTGDTMDIDSGITLVVEEDVILTVTEGFLYAYGTITNNGTISSQYLGIVNYGTVNGTGKFDFDAVSTKSDGTVWMYAGFKNTVQNALDGYTVTLFRNVSSSNTWIKYSITLDLGGYIVDGGSVYSNAVILVYAAGKDVTIKNGTVSSSQPFYKNPDTNLVETYGYTLWGYQANSITFEDLVVCNTTDNGYGVYISAGIDATIEDGCNFDAKFTALFISASSSIPAATITINGGIIGNANGTYGLCGNGLSDNTNIIINGGTIQAYNTAIYHPQVGDLTINGGTITGYYSGIQFSGEGALVINGGTVESTTTEVVELYKDSADGDGGIAKSGAAILFMSRGNGYQDGDDSFTGEINGGIIRSAANSTIIICRMGKDYTWVFDSEDAETYPNYFDNLTITGGTFIGNQISVEPIAEAEGVMTISGGYFSVAPNSDWLITGFAVSDDVNSNNYYYIINETISQVENALTDIEDLNNEEIINLATDIVDYDSETLAEDDDIIDSINDLDQLFETAVNDDDGIGTLITSAVAPETLESELTALADTAVEVSGLALSVYGGNTDSLLDDTITTVYIAVTEQAIDATTLIDADIDSETAIVLDIKPMQTVDGLEATEIDNDDLQTPVTFKIYLSENFEGNRATVYHITESGAVKEYNCTVLSDETGNYIKLTVTEFSNFIISPYTYTATTSSSTKYYTSKVADTKNGTVSLSSTSNASSSVVTITVTADDGYEVYSVTATYNSSNAAITDNGDGTYSYRQPSATATVTVTFVAVNSDDEDMVGIFDDVYEDAYYYDIVKWAVENNITTGYADNTFAPNKDCTREEVVTFLWRAAGEPSVDLSDAFLDVSNDAYYAKAVAWAIENNITKGTGDDTFGTGEVATRGQIVTFLYRLAGQPDVSADCNFTDVNSEAYYYDALLWAVENDITKGINDYEFAPDSPCTRAQIVTFLYRYLV